MKSVAIVILNWNGKELLEKFIPSVLKFSSGATIYIADNCSTDGSVSYVEKTFPEIKVVCCPGNYGYAGGYNFALTSLPEDIFILLNSDVEVTENWLPPLANLLLNNPDVACAQPKIKDLKDKTLFEYAGAAGGHMDKYGYPFCEGRIFDTIEKDLGQYNEAKQIFWASGACMAVKKDAFNEVGGFDPTFFAHMEEIDFCWRLQNKNYKIMYCPDSEVFHLGGATLSKVRPKKTYLNFRNNLLMLLKNLNSKDLYPIIFTRLILDGLAGLKFLLEGSPSHTWAIVKAHYYCYGKLFKILSDRKNSNKKLIKDLKGFYPFALPWKYYIENKKFFRDLKVPNGASLSS